MKGLKKATAFWAVYWALLGMFGVALIFDKETAKVIAVPIVVALTSLSGVSQGMNVADNVQRSKFYREELDKEGK